MLGRSIFTAIAIGLLAAPAAAQNAPIWSGLYIGAHGGYASSDWGVDLSHTTGAVVYNDPFPANANSLSSEDGWFGGLQIGANHQVGGLVFGIEADASLTDLEADGKFQTISTGACAPNSCTQWDIATSIEAMGTIRGRVGITAGSMLIYGTGGLAWAITDTDQETHHNGPAFATAGAVVSGDSTHIGYTVGGGAEWLLSPNWTVKAEYLYVDLGEADYHLQGTTTPTSKTPWAESFSEDLTMHTVRLGVNYKFGGPDYSAVGIK